MATAFHTAPENLSDARNPRRSAERHSGVTRANGAALARIGRQLSLLRAAGRRAVAIIDLDCGDGAVALAAGRKARMLGFLAITVRGFDRSAANVRAARRRAVGSVDPAIGFTFETAARARCPAVEDEEADILLLGPDGPPVERIARFCASQGAIVRHV